MSNALHFDAVSRYEYNLRLKQYRVENPALGAFLTVPVPEGSRCYLVNDGEAGFAITPDNSLVALFSDDAPSGTGERLVQRAVERGADSLFCFDTYLTTIYERCGFTEVDRGPWDEENAPEEWDYERFGTPDVVWMELQE